MDLVYSEARAVSPGRSPMKALVLFVCVAAVALASGCTIDGENGGPGMDFDPFNWGTGEPVFSPTDGFGYLDGQPFDPQS